MYGIFLVVLGHFTPDYKETYSAQVLYSFHLPLFFIISGYLNNPKKLPVFCQILNICKRLLVPYLLLIAIGFGLENSLTGGQIINLKWLVDIVVGRPYGVVSPMWFVHALMIIKIASVLHEWLKKHVISLYSFIWVVLLLFYVYIALTKKTLLPTYMCSILVAYPFFVFGGLVKKIEIMYDALPKFWRRSIIVMLATVPFIAVHFNGFVDLFLNIFGCNIVLYYVFGILASIGVLLACRQYLNKPSKIIETLSNGTLLIVAFHRIFLYFVSDFIDVFFIRFLLSIAIVLCFYFPIVICEKYCPVIIGKKRKQ